MLFRPTNKQLRRVLLSAKAKIKRGDEHFVCLALSRSMRSDPSRIAAVEYLRSYIGRVLGEHAYLDGWQRNGCKPLKNVDRTYAQRRLDRLAWIDWMIANLKEEG